VESRRCRIILFTLIFAINVTIAGSGAAATELIVHTGESIQTVINSAVPGDAIIVEPGVYEEGISAHTRDLTVTSKSGNPNDTIINGPGFNIWASNITIKGFTIKGTGESSGIVVIDRTGKCRIENNKILNYVSGIEIPAGNKLNLVNDNEISDCQEGIAISEGLKNVVSNNKIIDCQSGITFREGSGNIIGTNEISDCQNGITYMEGFETLINENKISNCGNGINVGNGDATLIENRIQVEKNTITKNDAGIIMSGGGGYTITGNTITLNKKVGYEDYSTGTNYVYNNYFNNTVNVKLGSNSRYESQVIWSIPITLGTNIIGGPYIGGNYWATPSGNGFSQTNSDTNGDGIHEGQYSLNEVDIDYLPLIAPAEMSEPSFPVANFSISVNIGPSPLSVIFIDLSRNATSLSWDFENDGIVDSTDKIPVHVYTIPGTYTVSLTASNQNGTDSKLTTITVLQETAAVTPIANFISNTTQGSAPLSIQFTDLSLNATSRIWDFNNDGNTDSFEETPTYVYSVPGNYTVNLTAVNGNIKASKLRTITVTGESGNNSGNDENSGDEINGRSHSNSRSYRSREPANNIEAKELAQAFIINGKATKIDFAKNKTCVVYLSFDAKKTTGKTTATVEMLRGKSALVSSLPSDTVYRSFNVWVEDGKLTNSNDIENPVICFKVEKSWVQNKGIDQSSIVLNRYNDRKWNQLPTNFLREESKYLYFTSNVSEISCFSITGRDKSIEGQTKIYKELKPDNKTDEEFNIDNNRLKTEKEEIKSTPGFEAGWGVVCLLGVLLYKKR
jgi:PGF-pre-PGF domain-containing protein